jgi:hypothetical protein
MQDYWNVLQSDEFLDFIFDSACDTSCYGPYSNCEKSFPGLVGSKHYKNGLVKAAYNDEMCSIGKHYRTCYNTNNAITSNEADYDIAYLLANTPVAFGNIIAEYCKDSSHLDDQGQCVYTIPDILHIIPELQEVFINNLDFFKSKVCDSTCTLVIDGSTSGTSKQHCIKTLNGYEIPMLYNEATCNFVNTLSNCKNPRNDKPSSVDSKNEDSNKTGLIVGCVVGGVAGIALIGCGIWFAIRYFKNKNQDENVEV